MSNSNALLQLGSSHLCRLGNVSAVIYESDLRGLIVQNCTKAAAPIAARAAAAAAQRLRKFFEIFDPSGTSTLTNGIKI